MTQANPRMLTINDGSASIKFALFEPGDSFRRVLKGGVDRIWLPEATLRVKGVNDADNFSRSVTAPDHTVAVGALNAMNNQLKSRLPWAWRFRLPVLSSNRIRRFGKARS